jgi:ribosome assembly protein YihI (activator of Der GTPase)
MGQGQKALNALKNGLSKLQRSVEKRRKALLDRLAKKEKLSVADETWLDNAGNLIDEEHVIETLDAASDFERGVGRLSDSGKAALYRLRQARHALKQLKAWLLQY